MAKLCAWLSHGPSDHLTTQSSGVSPSHPPAQVTQPAGAMASQAESLTWGWFSFSLSLTRTNTHTYFKRVS